MPGAASNEDRENRRADEPDHQHWFEPVADHLGAAYLRYSFTKGTAQEIEFVVEQFGLVSGVRVLDVGCGPGRHAHELARRGIAVHGIDISQTFVDLAADSAPPLATFERLDARELAWDASFDAAICLCQGGFGMMTGHGDDSRVFAGIARALKPGGRLALSAFNAYFVVKYHDDADFDAASGVSHELTEVKDPSGVGLEIELWTGCYTPRELRLLCEANALRADAVVSVEPGRYELAEPTVESPEFLLLATKMN